MASRSPTFTVVVPTRRRPRALARCLAAFAALDCPRDELEVIVVRDGEDDAHVSPPDGLQVTVLSQEREGPAAARNSGAAQAAGDFLAFTDDDCVPSSDWLARLRPHLESSPKAVVGGKTENGTRENRYSAASQLLIDTLYEHYKDRGVPRFFTSNNLALAANTFRELGGFDESFPFAGGEDRDFSDRCRERGCRLVYAPDAVVRHCSELSPRSFVRQHFTYGRGAAHFQRARIQRGLRRATVSPRFYLNLLGLPFKRYGIRGAPQAGLVVVTQAAYAAGYALEELKLRSGR